MRQEKPHSLSYQPMTRTIAPSTTAVWVESKVQEAAVWLRSMLTSGSVLIGLALWIAFAVANV